MRLKALATTGLVLSIGFSSFSYGGIASAETTGQIVAQEQQYRYDNNYEKLYRQSEQTG
jgi:hypothetical protein